MKINVLRYIAHKHVGRDGFAIFSDLNELARITTVHTQEGYFGLLKTANLQNVVILLDFQWELASSILAKGPTTFTCRALDVFRRTLVDYPMANIVITADLINMSDLLPLYKEGVKAILPNLDLPAIELSNALCSASEGNRYIVEQLTQQQKNYIKAIFDEGFKNLTDEEIYIVDMIINKIKTEDIREALGSRSIPSVRNKISKILKQLQVANRPELVGKANAIGMLPSVLDKS